MKAFVASEQAQALEAIIDTNTLSDVLYALEKIAIEKAAHLESAWQDSKTAKSWEADAAIVAKAAARICN